MLSRRDLVLSTAAIALARPAAVLAQPGPRETRAGRLLSSVAEALLAEYPENATTLGVDTRARAALKHSLPDLSAAGRAGHATAAADRLARLRKVDRAGLAPAEATALSAAIFAHDLAVEGYRRFAFGDVTPLDVNASYASSPYVANPGSGSFSQVPDFLDSKHTIATRDDAEAYLDRLSAFARGLDGETERFSHDAAMGVIPPDFTLDTAMRQLAGQRAQPVEQWGLVTSLDRRTRDKAIAGDWRRQALRLCQERVGPAIDRQLAAMRAVRPRATHEAGVWKQPQGEEWYRWALKAGTTTDNSPDELHRTGVAQNAELDAQMDALLRKQGLTKGTVGERMAALGKDPRNLWPNTDAGRTEVLAYLNGVVAGVRPRLPRAFSRLPKADVLIRRVPPEIQDGAPNGYAGAGSIDGSRPGIYYINLKDTANWPKFSLPTLTFHEAIPGHILQGTYQNKLPLIMSLLAFNAYSEGWALYSEQLGDELGAYDDDPLGKLGYLQSIKFRAVRLMVDTGMHAKRWSREKAIGVMADATGRPAGANTSEVERYCFWPGQACGYKVGHNEINRLRTDARRQLGSRFDVRGFNDAVVESGNVPLPVLAEVVGRYVTAAARA